MIEIIIESKIYYNEDSGLSYDVTLKQQLWQNYMKKLIRLKQEKT